MGVRATLRHPWRSAFVACMAAVASSSARDPEDPRDAAAPGRRLLVINALEDGASVDIFYAGARGRGV